MRNFINDYLFLNGWPKDKRKQLAFRNQEYLVIMTGQLNKKGINQVLKRYVPKHEKVAIMQKAYQGVFGGHYVEKLTKQKII